MGLRQFDWEYPLAEARDEDVRRLSYLTIVNYSGILLELHRI